MLAGCAVPAPGWAGRLAGDRVALLGEVHDNAALHARRLALLRDAVAAGWRPALVMEQFDVDRQADIERARCERPRDAGALIDAAAATRSGWDWALYRPVVELALAHGLPLVAANLSDALARRLVREDAEAALGATRATALRLAGPQAIRPDAAWREAQQREIDAGHCHALPASLLPGMARAQFARDATMAAAVERAAARGGVAFLAGNGHVRRDLGVPRWLRGIAPGRLWCVGFLEEGEDLPADAFDAVLRAPAAARGDPCERVAPPR